MLINDPKIGNKINPILSVLCQAMGSTSRVTKIQDGVYEIGHFNGDMELSLNYEEYPIVDDVGCYGVCDSAQNLLDKCPMLCSSERQFTVTLTKVEREQSNAGKGGGWRWHKWGEYIGSHEPTSEYLDDEPLIDHVYCYHIYELI